MDTVLCRYGVGFKTTERHAAEAAIAKAIQDEIDANPKYVGDLNTVRGFLA